MSIATRFPLLCAAVLALPAITVSADPGGAVFIDFNAGLLAVRLENAALSDVLRTVGEQAGVRVTIQGNLGNVQPQEFSGIPLPEGIKRLVENSNADLVMIYNRDTVRDRYIQEIRAYEGNRNNRTFISAPPHIPTPARPVQSAGF
jgi:hypothetical protein